jgi:hypothetical protein
MTPRIILAALQTAVVILLLTSCRKSSETFTQEQLPEFTLALSSYGWSGRFPNGPYRLFGQEITIEIHTRAVPDDPKVLPAVSKDQAALVRTITQALPTILKRVEEAMTAYNEGDPSFREFITNPHVWLDSEEASPDSWTFVIERKDNPNFGYHIEFMGTTFVEIWAGT